MCLDTLAMHIFALCTKQVFTLNVALLSKLFNKEVVGFWLIKKLDRILYNVFWHFLGHDVLKCWTTPAAAFVEFLKMTSEN